MTTWHVVTSYPSLGVRDVQARSSEDAARWRAKVLIADHIKWARGLRRPDGGVVTMRRSGDRLAFLVGPSVYKAYHIEPCENVDCTACASLRAAELQSESADLGMEDAA